MSNKIKVKTRLQLNALVITAAAVICVILINIIAYNLDIKKALHIDTTDTQTYVFSDETKYFFDNLEDDVTLYALYPNDGISDPVKESIELFPATSKRIKLEYVDIYRNPEFSRKYSENGAPVENYSVIVETGSRYEVVSLDDMYKFDNEGNQTIEAESAILNAIISVTNSDSVLKIYFTTGHGESACEEMYSALAADLYYVNRLNVALNTIPTDADMLICLAPMQDFSAEAIENIDNYLDNGGNAAFFFAPGLPKLPKLDSFLAEWGIEVNRDLVFEGDNSRNKSQSGFKSEPIPYIQADDYDININLIETNMDFVAPNSSSITIYDNNSAGAKVTPLLMTSPKAYAKQNISAEMSTEKESGDKSGRFTLAAMSRRSTIDDNNFADIFVSGSVDAFEGNGYLSKTGYANGDFMLNVIGYLTGRSDDAITSIRPKNATTAGLSMTTQQVNTIKFILQWIIPALIFIAGLVVWVRRRYL